MFKRILTVVASTALVSTSLMAQEQPAAATTEVDATKTAPADTKLPNVYGTLTLRHYEKEIFDGDKVDNSVPYNQGRFTLGTKLYNERVDANVTFFAQRNAGTTTISTPYAPEVIVEVKAIDAENYELKPYVDMFVPFHGKDANGNLGLINKLKAEQLTVLGNVSVQAYSEVYTYLVGGANYVDVQRRPGHERTQLGLLRQTPEGNLQTKQQDLGLTTEYGAYATLDVAKVSGLSLTAGLLYGRAFSPVYVSDPEDRSDQVDMQGYSADAETETLFDVSYKLTESLALSNTSYHFTNGFYEAGVNAGDAQGPLAPKGARFLNRTMLTYTMF